MLSKRRGLAISALVHAAVLLLAFDRGAKPVAVSPPQAIPVELVLPREQDEAPQAPAEPEISAAHATAAGAAGAAAPPAPEPPAAEAPVPSSENSSLADLLHVDVRGANPFDAPPSESKLSLPSAIARFKAHLQKCWTRPPGLGDMPKLRVVVRIVLEQDGRLAREPLLVAAPASTLGPALVASAMRALRACQPYNFLPADRHTDWRVLDVSFSQNGVS